MFHVLNFICYQWLQWQMYNLCILLCIWANVNFFSFSVLFQLAFFMLNYSTNYLIPFNFIKIKIHVLWFLAAVVSLIVSLLFMIGSVRSSKVLSQFINKRIFQNPIYFFEITPIGRILNRVHKDIDILDNMLPFVLLSTIMNFFMVNLKYYLTITIYF